MVSNDTDGACNGDEIADDVEQTVQDDALTTLLGDHAKTRMLMALLDAHPRALNPTSIVENGSLGSRQTWYNHEEDLLATGLVVEDEPVGNSPTYALADEAAELLEELRGRVNRADRLDD